MPEGTRPNLEIADETEIEASFCAAIRIAKEQKSVSLEKRAEGTYAEYRRQSERARRPWIPTTYLLTSCSDLPIVQRPAREILRRSPPICEIVPTLYPIKLTERLSEELH